MQASRERRACAMLMPAMLSATRTWAIPPIAGPMWNLITSARRGSQRQPGRSTRTLNQHNQHNPVVNLGQHGTERLPQAPECALSCNVPHQRQLLHFALHARGSHHDVGRTMVLRDLVALAVHAEPASATAAWLGGPRAACGAAHGRGLASGAGANGAQHEPDLW